MSEIDKKAKICPNCHKSQGNKLVKGLITVVVIVIVIFALAASCSKGVSDAVKETESKKDSLKLEENTVTTSNDGFAYYIEGYVKNESNESFSYVQITYTTYDKDGNTLGTCLDNNSGLEENGRWKFKAMCLSDVEDIASYKLTEITGY